MRWVALPSDVVNVVVKIGLITTRISNFMKWLMIVLTTPKPKYFFTFLLSALVHNMARIFIWGLEFKGMFTLFYTNQAGWKNLSCVFFFSSYIHIINFLLIYFNYYSHTYIHNWSIQPFSQDYWPSFSQHLCCVC